MYTYTEKIYILTTFSNGRSSITKGFIVNDYNKECGGVYKKLLDFRDSLGSGWGFRSRRVSRQELENYLIEDIEYLKVMNKVCS